jgi:hypothetical protein
MFGTIGAHVQYYLLNGSKGISYIQSLNSGHPKSSVHPMWSPVRTHKRLEAYIWSEWVKLRFMLQNVLGVFVYKYGIRSFVIKPSFI